MQRLDSTIVFDPGNKLLQGIACGNVDNKKKVIKFTIAFDGMFALCSQTHRQSKYANESLAISESILNYFKKEKDLAQVYVFDRGVTLRLRFAQLKNTGSLLFVGRLLENRKMTIVEERSLNGIDLEHGEFLQDNLVQVYAAPRETDNKGEVSKKYILIGDVF